MVPPDALRRTRRVTVGRKSIGALSGMGMLMISAVSGWAFSYSRSLQRSSSDLARAQRTVLTLRDSVRALRAVTVMVDGQLGPEMRMPVAGEITSVFADSRLHPLLGIFRPHHGVDISSPLGARIMAPAAGRVRFVGSRLGDGLVVELDHGRSLVSLFAHCSAALVRVGQTVREGDPIATVGATGLTTGPHLHFEVFLHGQPVDPLRYLSAIRDSVGTVAVAGSAAGDVR